MRRRPIMDEGPATGSLQARNDESATPRLTPLERVRLARETNRPQTLDYIEGLFTDFLELHGDRRYADDGAVIAGVARFHDRPIALAGHQRGRSTAERL